MATHSSVFAWRITGTVEPGGLPSMVLHRVGHDWSDLAAAAGVFVTDLLHLLWSMLSLDNSAFVPEFFALAEVWWDRVTAGSKVDQLCSFKIIDYWNLFFDLYENFSSVQFSRSVMSDSLWSHESQHTRPPCPSPTPGVHSDSRPSSQWWHPAVYCCRTIQYASSPQPFWHQGPVLWKTVFPLPVGRWDSLGMIQVHYIYCAPQIIRH